MYGNWALQNRPIALFPGHHGKDTGAVNGLDREHKDKLYSVEAVLNAELCQKVHHALSVFSVASKVYKGSLQERVAAANLDKCTLGVAIHHNAAKDRRARGYEVFHYANSVDGNTVASILADEFSKHFVVDGRTHGLPVKSGNFYVLRKTKFPCALVEIGFLTNTLDETWCTHEENQGATACAIVNSIINFIVNR